jgi:hypothetical protein
MAVLPGLLVFSEVDESKPGHGFFLRSSERFNALNPKDFIAYIKKSAG